MKIRINLLPGIAVFFLFFSFFNGQSFEDAMSWAMEGVELMQNERYHEAIEKLQISLEVFEELEDDLGEDGPSIMRTLYVGLGASYYRIGDYNKGLEYLLQAIRIDEEMDIAADYAESANLIGLNYESMGQFDKAMEYYNESLSVYKAIENEVEVATVLGNMGLVYFETGDYDKALDSYEQSLRLNISFNDPGAIGKNRVNIGQLLTQTGQFDKALEQYNLARPLLEEAGNKVDQILLQSHFGSLFSEWGQYDKALEYYQDGLQRSKEMGLGEEATFLGNIGYVYVEQGKPQEAIDYFKKALDIDRSADRDGNEAVDLGNIGVALCKLERYEEALEKHNEALEINDRIGNLSQKADNLNNIGLVYDDMNQSEKAIEYYKQALEIEEDLNISSGLAVTLNNLGAVYVFMGKYDEAVDNLKQAIDILEKLRLTATGSARLDYLASQLFTYQWLIYTYLQEQQPVEAFNTAELSSAKYLSEQLGEKASIENLDFAGADQYAASMEGQTAVINIVDLNTFIGKTAKIVLGKEKTFQALSESEPFIKSLAVKVDMASANASVGKLRGMKRKKAKSEEMAETRKTDRKQFDNIINYYRLLLAKPNPSPAEDAARKEIARALYNYIFSDIETALANKTELVIIPGGILAFIPFETLIMPDGRYLIEKYNIKYTQSLTVSDILKKRTYAEDRKPLLAMGGAVYDQLTYAADMTTADEQLDYLEANTLLAINRGQSARESYQSLGVQWGNLPGTLAEVKAIAKIVPGVEMKTGEEVSEAAIKSLSRDGQLKKYKILHFATHGVVVPEIPELSAIVLSLFSDERDNEDGYLRMGEITGLDINADFVNLSACETGLGKIYGGEGVIGLTQSFLIAGANGLSVSLWQVADESTMKFMIGMYQTARDKGLSWDQAITAMKREFISGKKYSRPFYWAPFVYYGK